MAFDPLVVAVVAILTAVSAAITVLPVALTLRSSSRRLLLDQLTDQLLRGQNVLPEDVRRVVSDLGSIEGGRLSHDAERLDAILAAIERGTHEQAPRDFVVRQGAVRIQPPEIIDFERQRREGQVIWDIPRESNI